MIYAVHRWATMNKDFPLQWLKHIFPNSFQNQEALLSIEDYVNNKNGNLPASMTVKFPHMLPTARSLRSDEVSNTL